MSSVLFCVLQHFGQRSINSKFRSQQTSEGKLPGSVITSSAAVVSSERALRAEESGNLQLAPRYPAVSLSQTFKITY